MRTAFIILISWVVSIQVQAQQIVFDRGVKAGQLTVFPEINNPNNYYYLLDKAQVATNVNGQPMFSFIRYVRNSASAGATASTITESNDAGGVLHVLVSLNVPEDMRKDAERQLQRLNSANKLVGPIIYKSGKVAVTSSVIGSDGELTRKVVGIGAAPILDGQKAAISVLLTKQGADILWATFQTQTPDLSFAFEMDAKGFLSPKSVKIEADFEQIYSHKSMEVAAVSPVLAAEIKASFDELSNSGAIKVTQIGDDADLNKLKETAYNQLINLMFDRVGGQGVPELSQVLGLNNRPSMLDRATDMLNRARTEARQDNERLENQARVERDSVRAYRNRTRAAMQRYYRELGVTYNPPASREDTGGLRVNRVPIPSLAIAASFQLKEIKRTGKYVIDLNKYTEDQKTFPFAENVGPINKQCPSCFKSVNLDDPLYKQREIQTQLVGISSQDFDSFLNNVEVVVRKKHENNEETVQNIVINKSKFNLEGNAFGMRYGWKDDNNRKKWLSYDFRTKWTYSNGATVETPWVNQEFSAINLIPPFIKKDIYVELDPEFVQRENLRGAEVKIYNNSTGKAEIKTINLKSTENGMSKSIELIMPAQSDTYEYEVVLFPKNKEPIKIPKKSTTYGSLYLDSIQNQE